MEYVIVLSYIRTSWVITQLIPSAKIDWANRAKYEHVFSWSVSYILWLGGVTFLTPQLEPSKDLSEIA